MEDVNHELSRPSQHHHFPVKNLTKKAITEGLSDAETVVPLIL